QRAPSARPFPYTTLFRSVTNGLTWTHLTLNTEGGDGSLADPAVREAIGEGAVAHCRIGEGAVADPAVREAIARGIDRNAIGNAVDRKSTRLNSSHVKISY